MSFSHLVLVGQVLTYIYNAFLPSFYNTEVDEVYSQPTIVCKKWFTCVVKKHIFDRLDILIQVDSGTVTKSKLCCCKNKLVFNGQVKRHTIAPNKNLSIILAMTGMRGHTLL